jgi:transposase
VRKDMIKVAVRRHPLAVSLTGGHRSDVTQLMPSSRPARRQGRRGRPRRRPGRIYADRGYDRDKYRTRVREKGTTPVIARSTGYGSGLGTYRWVVERSLGLLHCFRRLRIGWEIRGGIREAAPQPPLRHHLLAPSARPLHLL